MNEELNPYETPHAAPAPVPAAGEGELNLASRWRRLGGSLLDSLVMMVLILPLMFMLGMFDRIDAQGRMSLGDTILASVIGIACFMAINGMLIYKHGQTVGKRILGMRVVNLDGTQVEGNRYVVRRLLLPFWIIPQIPLVGQIFGIVNVLLIFRKDHNCLHDDFARTRVIKLPKEN
ncbi:MAG: RDD family protein [Verrucomicrobiota bacterium]